MTTLELQQLNSMDASDFHHTPCYCEENVYFLCKKLCSNGIADAQGSDLFVVFISNDNKQIPLWHQKASHRADGVILWDYHVICIQRKRDGDTHFVWDLDSSLPFPCPLATYMSETVRPSFQLFSEFQRFFRVVHAPIFLHHFASDRRHMKDSDGNWTAQPPTYETIVAEDGSVHNLNEYIEIHAADVGKYLPADLTSAVFSQKHGVVFGEAQLEEFVSQIS
ncbi:protein N-terminal glutamine amidohydrolase isoform X1 [Herrania umbratica]|uniref:Protein N-terminal glutamine amidohydrolase n=1 Tax=Herrania umbratica TaxID=108875 RepID=A0A6J1A6M1_9ROSI|nr:protein N-terminal glutamine amidohydrolase isoform X1 [Herrania umbratica]